MAWHMGHPLSQTLFTSVYLDKLLWPVPRTIDEARFVRGQNEAGGENGNALVHLVLRAYCLALVKCCAAVHSRITAEYFYEVSHGPSLESGQHDRLTEIRRRILFPSYTIAPSCQSLTCTTSTVC